MKTPATALDQISQKILVHLRRGALRWRDLHALIRPTNDPQLAGYLHRLASAGLILRRMEHAGPPARVFYDLSSTGRELANHAMVLMEWSERDARAASQVEGARSAA